MKKTNFEKSLCNTLIRQKMAARLLIEYAAHANVTKQLRTY